MKITFENILEEDSEILQKGRIKFLYVILIAIFTILTSRLFYLTVFLKKGNIELKNYISTNGIQKRVDIVDRNGVIVATDLDMYNFYMNRDLITNPKLTAEKIAKIIPEIDVEKLYQKLINTENMAKFFLIKNNITPKQQLAIKNAEILGFEFIATKGRIYPHNNLFSHVVGYVDVDRNGISGLEKEHNQYLKNPNNEPLKLTFDVRIQSILRQQLQNAMKKYGAKSIWGIVYEVKTGKILASVTLPDFNPNRMKLVKRDYLFDKVNYGVYEMGSIFKMFTIANGFETNTIDENKKYDISQVINYGKFSIRQNWYSTKFLTPEEILVRSSNIGAALIAIETGQKKQEDFLRKLGLLDRVPAKFPSLAKPLIPKIWRDINTITISYGHGISVTPLHVAMSVAGIVNHGIMKNPKFTEFDENQETAVISAKTSDIMVRYLRRVVSNGTGWRANTLGYSVGGKTGSARLLKNGAYQEKNILANFVGVFPMNNPHFLVYVMVESPDVSTVESNDVSGGIVAAPIVSRIIENIAPVLNVVPYMERIQ